MGNHLLNLCSHHTNHAIEQVYRIQISHNSKSLTLPNKLTKTSIIYFIAIYHNLSNYKIISSCPREKKNRLNKRRVLKQRYGCHQLHLELKARHHCFNVSIIDCIYTPIGQIVNFLNTMFNAITNSCKTKETMDLHITKNSVQIRRFAPCARLYI